MTMTDAPTEAMLTRIRGLLAKAERTDNPHEADAFSAKAAELMARYAIDRMMLGDMRTQRTVGKTMLSVEEPYGMAKLVLLNQVAKAWDCSVMATKARNRSTGEKTLVASLYGSPDALVAVEALYTSLLVQAARQIQTVRGLTSGDTRSLRQGFMIGFAEAAGERVAAARSGVISETPGASLVLADAKSQADAALRAEHPRLASASVSGGSAVGRREGQAAGARADIGMGGVAASSNRRSIGAR